MAGRLFDAHDNFSAPRVSVISEALARHYFPNPDPLGQEAHHLISSDGAMGARDLDRLGTCDGGVGQEPGR